MSPLLLLLSVPLLPATAPPRFPPGGKVWKPVLGDWSKPVLTADPASWEADAVQEPQVIAMNGSLRMWYRGAGWGVASGLGVADSTDGGRTWKK